MENYNNTPQRKPDSNLVLAIISTMMCCMPLGIVSIINATKVDSLWNEGRYAEAEEAAAAAKKWGIFAIVGGALYSIFVFSFYFLVIIAGY
jgi:hypothetical protein